MTADGHLLFYFSIVFFAKKIFLKEGDLWHIITGGILTCLLPDIDHPKSILGKRIKWLSIPIAQILGHRGFTHSILAILLCIILFRLQLSPVTIITIDIFHGMIVGYISHIIADMLTPAGVPLLWPCSFRFRVPILSSKKIERCICTIMLIITINFVNYNKFI